MVPAAEAWLSVSRSHLSFPRIRVGETWTDSVSIYNFGQEDARRLMVTDTCFRDFVPIHNCFMQLNAGQTCTVTVQYQPSSTGSHSCMITVASENQGTVVISASGTAN